MLFHEIFGSYYRVTEEVLKAACEGVLTREKLTNVIRERAFGESGLTIPDGLTGERWRLIHRDFTAAVKRPPYTPISILEKRWLKAMLLDPRIQLFSPDISGLENVEPLFTPDMIVFYDRYTDGDPFTDSDYVEHFRCILAALEQKQNLRVRYEVRRGISHDIVLTPHYLEYSKKDNQFRLVAAEKKKNWILNLSGISACEVEADGSEYHLGKQKKRSLTFVLTDRRNALERVLLHFSHLEKETRKIDNEHYQVKLYFDPQDETEMLIRILSFGKMIRVTEPEEFICKLMRRITRQADLLASFSQSEGANKVFDCEKERKTDD